MVQSFASRGLKIEATQLSAKVNIGRSWPQKGSRKNADLYDLR